MDSDYSVDSGSPRMNPPAGQPVVAGKPDKHIWGIYILLCLFSIVELYSASSREVSASAQFGVLGPVVRHIIFLLIGLGIMLFLQSRHYRDFKRFTYPFAVLSVLMMVYVIFFGEVINGARRSMNLLGFQIQPAEFLKLAAVLTLAYILSRNQIPKGGGVNRKGVWQSAAWVLLFGALLAKQGLTNTVLVMVISLSVMLIAGVSFKNMGKVVGVYALCGALFAVYLTVVPESDSEKVKTEMTVVRTAGGNYITQEVEVKTEGDQKAGRMQTWINRWNRFRERSDEGPMYEREIDAENRQEMYSYIAQAHGGKTGVGPGNSREAARLPLAFSDYIYSIIVEEFGLVGGVVVLILYLWLLARASAVASKCSRAYPALLVLGLAVMIVWQALVHMSITTGAGPVSGQPLPLISKGGTSIIITSIAFGLMLSVSRHAVRHRDKQKSIRQEVDALPEDIRAVNPTQL
nr:FtsW/RodA/SpoVE family cell cycle protein [Bacteroides sp.]